MKANKFLALVLAMLMVFSLAACAGGGDVETTAPATTTAPETDPPETTAPPAPKVEASVDFEDGNAGFVAVYKDKAFCDDAVVEVADYNGSKALKVTNGSGGQPFVAIDVTSLLGVNAPNVASVEMTLGLEHPDGTFYAASGSILTWTGDDLAERSNSWSVYLENKNPKTVSRVLETENGEVFSAETPNILMVSLSDDNAAEAGDKNVVLYIDDIRFLDADGNLIKADTTVVFNAPKGFSSERDMSNLVYVGGATLLDGSAITGAGWGQTDIGSSVEQWLPLMVPGAVIEIEYTSEDGAIWLVVPDGAAGWKRINGENGVEVKINNSQNIAQITYEDLVAVLGEDTSTWGGRLQGESSSNWEIFSVKIGTDSGLVTVTDKVLLDGSSITGAGWGQTDVGATVDQWLPLMVPGAVIEISYKSEDGSMWIVLPDAANGWTRLDTVSNKDGATAQITYEDIVSVLGEDTSTWGGRIQCEAASNWEVYSVSIGTAVQ